MRSYLDFEKPVAELEAKLDELRALETGDSAAAIREEITRLEAKAAQALKDLYAELSKDNPLFKKMYDSLLAFRADSLAWNQVAELSFDSFMMRMRTRT